MAVVCSLMMIVACHSKKVAPAPGMSANTSAQDTAVGVVIVAPITMEVTRNVGKSMKSQQKELIHALEVIEYTVDQGDTIVTIDIVPDPNKLDAIKLGLNDSILFKFNSAKLTPKAEMVLGEVAKSLKNFPDTYVTMVGYASHTGQQQYNYALSVKRAQSVMDYFEDQGIPASRLKAIGKGWNDPVASNKTAKGRAKNQRVAIWISPNENMVTKAKTK